MLLDIIQKDLRPAHIEELGVHTLAIMEEYKTADFPVVDGQNKLLGIIKESDILNMEDLEKPLSFLKHQFKKIFTFLNTHFFESMKIIAQNKITILPIVNEENYYVGYLTPMSIINQLAQTQQDYQNTSIIILSTQPKNYSLAELSRLIEENNGKILTLWNELLIKKINIHLLIKCENAERIIQTLERYDYLVTKTFINNPNNNNLDDRFESFIKYLNP